MRLAEALDDMVDGRAPVTTDRGERQPGWDSPGARPLDADMALDHIERAVAADGISMYEHQEEAILEILAGNHVISHYPDRIREIPHRYRRPLRVRRSRRALLLHRPHQGSRQREILQPVRDLRSRQRRHGHRGCLGQRRRPHHLLHRRDPR
ncbi:hypothetical protein HMPREF9565_00444 [Cutibacterium acnes HL053PA2]|nr:hypothetical protein HMPREF9565_00444 [Cutibacterium acnes HL053PA2]